MSRTELCAIAAGCILVLGLVLGSIAAHAEQTSERDADRIEALERRVDELEQAEAEAESETRRSPRWLPEWAQRVRLGGSASVGYFRRGESLARGLGCVPGLGHAAVRRRGAGRARRDRGHHRGPQHRRDRRVGSRAGRRAAEPGRRALRRFPGPRRQLVAQRAGRPLPDPARRELPALQQGLPRQPVHLEHGRRTVVVGRGRPPLRAGREGPRRLRGVDLERRDPLQLRFEHRSAGHAQALHRSVAVAARVGERSRVGRDRAHERGVGGRALARRDVGDAGRLVYGRAELHRRDPVRRCAERDRSHLVRGRRHGGEAARRAAHLVGRRAVPRGGGGRRALRPRPLLLGGRDRRGGTPRVARARSALSRAARERPHDRRRRPRLRAALSPRGDGRLQHARPERAVGRARRPDRQVRGAARRVCVPGRRIWSAA